ncbi:MAG: FecR domain-containing protein [Deltaproteobacteria bacterium]|nr:FecR domain-containing protein [Deltaproteobacteria bacterium]
MKLCCSDGLRLIALLLLFGCAKGDPQIELRDAGEAKSNLRRAQLVLIEGEVRVKRSGDPEWQTALAGMQLSINDKIRTQRGSFATIEFQRGGQLHMQPESLVAVTDLRMNARTRAHRSTFTLESGQVEAELDAITHKDAEFRIRTPSAEASVIRREVAFQ